MRQTIELARQDPAVALYAGRVLHRVARQKLADARLMKPDGGLVASVVDGAARLRRVSSALRACVRGAPNSLLELDVPTIRYAGRVLMRIANEKRAEAAFEPDSADALHAGATVLDRIASLLRRDCWERERT